jgi:hypothetical protein
MVGIGGGGGWRKKLHDVSRDDKGASGGEDPGSEGGCFLFVVEEGWGRARAAGVIGDERKKGLVKGVAQ